MSLSHFNSTSTATASTATSSTATASTTTASYTSKSGNVFSRPSPANVFTDRLEMLLNLFNVDNKTIVLHGSFVDNVVLSNPENRNGSKNILAQMLKYLENILLDVSSLDKIEIDMNILCDRFKDKEGKLKRPDCILRWLKFMDYLKNDKRGFFPKITYQKNQQREMVDFDGNLPWVEYMPELGENYGTYGKTRIMILVGSREVWFDIHFSYPIWMEYFDQGKLLSKDVIDRTYNLFITPSGSFLVFSRNIVQKNYWIHKDEENHKHFPSISPFILNFVFSPAYIFFANGVMIPNESQNAKKLHKYLGRFYKYFLRMQKNHSETSLEEIIDKYLISNVEFILYLTNTNPTIQQILSNKYKNAKIITYQYSKEFLNILKTFILEDSEFGKKTEDEMMKEKEFSTYLIDNWEIFYDALEKEIDIFWKSCLESYEIIENTLIESLKEYSTTLPLTDPIDFKNEISQSKISYIEWNKVSPSERRQRMSKSPVKDEKSGIEEKLKEDDQSEIELKSVEFDVDKKE